MAPVNTPGTSPAKANTIRRRFKRLVEVTPEKYARPGGQALARFLYNLVDHGFLRVWWTNLHEIAPGVWRSNQPGPKRIKAYAEMGIKNILVLRGPGNGAHLQLEIEAAREAGVALHFIGLAARAPCSKANYRALFEFFRTLERPFLMHCKSGADRAGIASAMYLLWLGRPLDEAREMLAFRYVHLKSTKTGILDVMLDQYGDDIAKHGPIGIEEWIEDHYDLQRLADDFAAGRRHGKPWPKGS